MNKHQIQQPQRYSATMIAIHWGMAAIIIALLALGNIMHDLPRGDAKFAAYQAHKSLGILILALIVIRIAVRSRTTIPPHAAPPPTWEKILANTVHWGLYALMIVMPISGWAMSSKHTTLFGFITLPPFPTLFEGMRASAHQAHEIIAWILLGAIILHLAAGLRHHFILRDNALLRMMPRKKDRKQKQEPEKQETEKQDTENQNGRA